MNEIKEAGLETPAVNQIEACSQLLYCPELPMTKPS